MTDLPPIQAADPEKAPEIKSESTMKNEQASEENTSAENNNSLFLYLKDQNGNILKFKMKKHAELRKLFHKYAQNQGVSLDNFRFYHKLSKLRSEHRPIDLNMQDEDTIDVFVQQVGGYLA
ncbi:MAG: Small ubiquitin-related modifier 3 [Marteilia pararefringens]